MVPISPQHQKWLLKRRYSTFVFSLQSLVLGMEYSLTFLTLWLYIKEMVATDNPKLYYAIVSISYLVSSTAFTPVIGRIVDRTRHIRATFLFCNALLLIGNVVYSVYFSPWLLVSGRFLSGCGAGLKSVICSEIIRSYPSSQTSVQLSLVSMMFQCGFILGPGVNFFFKNVNIFLGKWHLTNVNFIGIFMAILCGIMEVLSLTMVHDLSKEYDLKGEEETLIKEALIKEANTNFIYSTIDKEEVNQYTPLVNGEQGKNADAFTFSSHAPTISVFRTLKLLFTTYNPALLLITTFFIMFFVVTIDMWLPLLIVETLNLTILELNIFVFGTGCSCVIILLLYMWKPVSDYKMFMLVLVAFFGISIVYASFITLKYFQAKLLVTTIAVICMLSFACVGIVPDVYVTNTLSKMVNSRHQTFVDSIRNSMNAIGSLLGLATATYVFQYLEVFAVIYIVITCILGCMFMGRRKSLIKPKIVF